MQIRSTYDSKPERIFLLKERLQELHSAMNTLTSRKHMDHNPETTIAQMTF